MDFWGVVLLSISVAISLGCDAGTPEQADALAPPEAIEFGADTTTLGESKPVEVERSESATGGQALADESMEGALEGPEPPPVTPLDDLLMLPESVTKAHRDLDGRDQARDAADPEAQAKRKGAGFRVDGEAREDTAGFDPKRQRRLREAEAGVAVDIDEGTSVRGGVRAQQEDDEAWTEPVPTVGIEKRF